MGVYQVLGDLLVGSVVKNLSVMQKMQETPRVRYLGRENPLEEGMATHSNVLVLEEPMQGSLAGSSS